MGLTINSDECSGLRANKYACHRSAQASDADVHARKAWSMAKARRAPDHRPDGSTGQAERRIRAALG